MILVACAIALAGVGLSAIGYYQSLQLAPETTTELLTTTSSMISAQTYVTSSEGQKFSDFQMTVRGTSGTNYGCETNAVDIKYSDGTPIIIDAGQIHVTLSTQPSNAEVDFWVLTPTQYSAWQGTQYCSDMEQVSAIYFQKSLSSYDGIIPIPKQGSYYFAFANFGQGPTSVTITVAQVTQTEAINYSTEVSVFPTEQVSSVLRPLGFGLDFYFGVGAAVAGAALTAFLLLNHSGARSEPRVEEVAEQSRFCQKCGSSLLPNARFCKECGTRFGHN